MHQFMFRSTQKVFPGSMWQVMAFNGRNFYRSKGGDKHGFGSEGCFPECMQTGVAPSYPYLRGGKPGNEDPYTFLAVNDMGLIPVHTEN